MPGVWVAGNAANPRAQVITAAGEGSAAAIAINNDLVDEDVRHGAHRHTTDDKEHTMTMTVPPPTKHQLALMIWLAVVPTLIGLNLLLDDALADLSTVPQDVRPRHDRGADRHLRPDAPAAPRCGSGSSHAPDGEDRGRPSAVSAEGHGFPGVDTVRTQFDSAGARCPTVQCNLCVGNRGSGGAARHDLRTASSIRRRNPGARGGRARSMAHAMSWGTGTGRTSMESTRAGAR